MISTGTVRIIATKKELPKRIRELLGICMLQCQRSAGIGRWSAF